MTGHGGAPAPADEPVFAAEGIGRSFGRHDVLRGAAVWLRPGRVTVMLGGNGVGKTTFLRCALGVIPLHYGTVRFRGRVHTRPRLHRLARAGLWYLPTERLVSRRRTLRAQIASAVRARSVFDALPGAPDAGAIVSTLALKGLLDVSPHTLSGGEMRRAEMALALARAPLCLIADEPLYGIAPLDCTRIASAIAGLAALGAAVLVTGHEVHDLLELADEVVWLTRGGSTHGLGAPEEARRNIDFRREYLAGR